MLYSTDAFGQDAGMKYLGYFIVLCAGIAGFLGVRIWVLLFLALLSSFTFLTARRQNLKDMPQAPDQNMLIDGMFLLFSQLLVLFVVYLVGVFIAGPGGDLFMRPFERS